jgi:hypothetical protein
MGRVRTILGTVAPSVEPVRSEVERGREGCRGYNLTSEGETQVFDASLGTC